MCAKGRAHQREIDGHIVRASHPLRLHERLHGLVLWVVICRGARVLAQDGVDLLPHGLSQFTIVQEQLSQPLKVEDILFPDIDHNIDGWERGSGFCRQMLQPPWPQERAAMFISVADTQQGY
jgi:hypothetical protein